MTGLSLSDGLGVAGSLLLLVAPGRDQYLRWRVFVLTRKPGSLAGDMDKLRGYVASGRERRRNRWSFWDSLSMASGALLLCGAYLTT